MKQILLPWKHLNKGFQIMTVFLMLGLFSTTEMQAQCPDDNVAFGTTTPTCNGGNTVATTCIFGGEYRTLNVIAGNTYTVSTCGDMDFDTQITVYRPGSVFLAYNDDYCGLQSSVTFVAPATEALRVLVDQFFCAAISTCMTLNVSCAAPPAPANDLCVNGINLPGNNGTVGGTTVGSTNDNVGTCGTSNTAGGVWYTWTDTSGLGGNLNLFTCNQAAYDTKISVFTGSCGFFVCQGGNDDGPGCAGFTSDLTVATDGSSTYRILVHGFGSATGTFNLSYAFTQPPIINCPMPDPLVANTEPGICTAAVTFSDAVAIDPDGGPVSVMQTMGPMSGSQFPLGDTIVEFTATDDEGDTSTCQFTVTVVDNQPPMVTCPADITMDSDPGICGAVVTYNSPMVVDNCFMAGGSATYDQTITITNPALMSVNNFAFTSAEVGATTDATLEVRTFGDIDGTGGNLEAWGIDDEDTNNVGQIGATGVFADQCNSILMETFMIPAAMIDTWAADGQIDFTGTDIGGNINLTLCGGDFLELRLFYDYSVSSAPYTVITGFDSGEVFPVGTTLTTLEYTDPGGNSVQCTFNVTVNDVEAPTVSCVGAGGPVTASASVVSGDPINDGIGPTVSVLTIAEDRTIDDLNVDLDITHTWVGDMDITLESPMGTVVTIMDRPGVPASTFGCSGNDILASLDDEAATPVEDECGGGTPTIMGSFIPNNLLDAFDGESTMGDWILTVTDNAGGDNGTLNEWGITYEYTGGPLQVFLDVNGEASVPATALATGWDDNCGPGGVTITGGINSPMPMTLPTTLAGGNGNFGNMFDINALTNVTIQSFDIHGDTGAVFDVEVYAKSGTWVGSENNAGAWTLIGTAPGVVSNGDGVVTPLNLTLNYAIPAGETHAFYVTPTDFSTGGFNYTNGTATGNVFASDANIEFLEGAGKGYPFSGTTFQPRVFNGNIQYEANAGGGGGMVVDFTCDDLGFTEVTVTATDAAGNESSCIATVEVIDNLPPVLVCMDVTIGVGPNGTTAITPMDLLAETPTTYDVISISSDNASGTEGFTDLTADVTTAEVVSFDWDYTTMDGPQWDSFGYLLNGVFTELTNPAGANSQSGNSGPINLNPGDNFGFRSYSFDGNFGPCTTTVSNFVPGFDGQFDPANWVLTLTNSDGDAFFVEIPGGPLSYDNCGITTMAVDIIEVTCDDIASSPLIATVFASDGSGNLAACQSMITVVDLLGPEVTCPADQTVDPGPGNLFYILPDYWALGEATAIDNCTDPVVLTSMNPPAGTPLSDGVYTIEVIAEDEYGNVTICTFELTVESILGVDDNALNNAISMYPNPAREFVTIANGSNILLDNAMIYDVNGKLISTIDLHNMGREKVIDVSALASGVYMVQITSERSSVIKRLLKE